MNTDQCVSRINALGREIDEYANAIAPSAWAGDLHLQNMVDGFRTLAARKTTDDTQQLGLPGVAVKQDNLRCWHCGKPRPTARKDKQLSIAEVETGWRRSEGGTLGWGTNDLCCPDCTPAEGSSIQRDGITH